MEDYYVEEWEVGNYVRPQGTPIFLEDSEYPTYYVCGHKPAAE